ncbi:MAG: NfeD family protein [Geodermatophilaceae bacterium]
MTLRWLDVPMEAWVIWLIAAGVLAGAELLTLDFVLLMLAGGALGGMAAAAAGAETGLQLVAFVIVALALLVFVRPFAKRQLLSRTPQQIDGAETYVGKVAVVTARVDHMDGRIRFGADDWSAVSQSREETFEVGSTVRVMQIRGATAVVAESHE